MDTTCDLLRDCKTWAWGDESLACFGDIQHNMQGGGVSVCEAGREWRIRNVKRTMTEALPVKVVIGEAFHWCVRLDTSSDGKLRIVYESAIDTPQVRNACIKRFPAAIFSWDVIYRGQAILQEKPIFICFPQGVALHWSTTLNIHFDELTEADDIQIKVHMSENPLVSLILYYFSSNLSHTMESEDILNRLPHIEYRCLSSYSLYQQTRGSTLVDVDEQSSNVNTANV